MAFCYSFSAPRTKPVHFESIGSSSASSAISSVLSFVTGGGKKEKEKEHATTAASASSSSTSSASQPSDLTAQLESSSPSHNLKLASECRARVQLALQTHFKNDPEIEIKRVQLLEAYLPFIRTIVQQHQECTSDQQKKHEKSGTVLEWCTVLLTGARPTADDKVPFFSYQKLDLLHELAHAYFTLGLCHYQRAGSLSFHALQYANSIAPCSFLQLVPDWAKLDQPADSSSSSTPVRKFNPLSYEPPQAASATPKTPAETAEIRKQIIEKRKQAVGSLRTAASIFTYLGTSYLPSVPVPMQRIPDTLPAVSTALAALSLVHVQQHTILSAILSAVDSGKQANPALLSKLCLGIVTHLQTVQSTLQTGSGSFFRALEQSLHEFLRISIEYYSVMKLVYYAVDLELRAEHGQALSILQHASEVLTKLTNGINLQTIRDCNPVISELKQWLTIELTKISLAMNRLKKDNDSIYYQAVPSYENAIKELEKEEGLFMPTAPAYTLPKELPALFFDDLPSASKEKYVNMVQAVTSEDDINDVVLSMKSSNVKG